jgi:hypothetical protein
VDVVGPWRTDEVGDEVEGELSLVELSFQASHTMAASSPWVLSQTHVSLPCFSSDVSSK